MGHTICKPSPVLRNHWQLIVSKVGWWILVFEDVATGGILMLQWMAPRPCIYRQHYLEVEDEKKEEILLLNPGLSNLGIWLPTLPLSTSGIYRHTTMTSWHLQKSWSLNSSFQALLANSLPRHHFFSTLNRDFYHVFDRFVEGIIFCSWKAETDSLFKCKCPPIKFHHFPYMWQSICSFGDHGLPWDHLYWLSTMVLERKH